MRMNRSENIPGKAKVGSIPGIMRPKRTLACVVKPSTKQA
uniref:Uncharacterized protein n=1 Tax=Arundo donax TaxID=35708 RepID=A0A0A9FML1_ARUDO